jgi:membrane protease YdiL (CAAX protease family)
MTADATIAVGEAAWVGGRVRRLVEVTLFVGAWIAIGLLLRLNDGSRYLLVGVPLTVAFQLLVRRRPVRELWVREWPPFRLDARAVVIGAVLLALAYPAYLKLLSIGVVEGWLLALWMAAYVVGALAATYALRNLHADGRAWLLAALAAGIGAAWMLTDLASARGPLPAAAMLVAGLQEAALAFGAGFVVEEVAFRGLVDAHVHRPGESRARLSALFVSALWGLWHVPVGLGMAPLAVLIPVVVIQHSAIGIPLSFAWRRSGNLVLPAAAHAVIDAVRDGLAAAL